MQKGKKYNLQSIQINIMYRPGTDIKEHQQLQAYLV